MRGALEGNQGAVIEDRDLQARQAKPGAEFYVLSSQQDVSSLSWKPEAWICLDSMASGAHHKHLLRNQPSSSAAVWRHLGNSYQYGLA